MTTSKKYQHLLGKKIKFVLDHPNYELKTYGLKRKYVFGIVVAVNKKHGITIDNLSGQHIYCLNKMDKDAMAYEKYNQEFNFMVKSIERGEIDIMQSPKWLDYTCITNYVMSNCAFE